MPITNRVTTKSLEGKPNSKSCTNFIVFLETKTNKSQMIVKIRLCDLSYDHFKTQSKNL
jgi:hypothetical protein